MMGSQRMHHSIHASLVDVIQGSHDVLGFRVAKRVTISGGWVTAVVGRASNSSYSPVSPKRGNHVLQIADSGSCTKM